MSDPDGTTASRPLPFHLSQAADGKAYLGARTDTFHIFAASLLPPWDLRQPDGDSIEP